MHDPSRRDEIDALFSCSRGKEKLSFDVDEATAARLRAAGFDPAEFAARAVQRAADAIETPAERTARQGILRRELPPGIDAHDALVEADGLWSDGLRAF
jgi:hypothetical protein